MRSYMTCLTGYLVTPTLLRNFNYLFYRNSYSPPFKLFLYFPTSHSGLVGTEETTWIGTGKIELSQL